MKKVVIVSNTSWSLYNFRLSLMKAIKDEGYEVIAVAPHDEYSQKLIDLGFEYHDIRMNNKGTNPIEDIKTTLNFYSLYKKIKPDGVLHYTIKPNIYGTIASSILGIRVINNIAGLGTLFITQNFITKIAKVLYKFSQSKADKIFFQNRDDFEMFTMEELVKKSKCDILPGSGVDTNRFKPINRVRTDDTFRFLLIARMLWDKGVGEYVEAAKIFHSRSVVNVEFLLLGFLDTSNHSAITKEQMNKWVESGLVNYLGVSDNVEYEIAKADCIVLPSYYREGTPRTLLESASMAKPIITTDNVGCKDVVDDGVNGFLCKMRDVNDLVSKMEKIISFNENDRDIMGLKGREKMIKEFDEKIVIDKYLDAIESLL